MTTSPCVAPAPRDEQRHLIVLDPTRTHALVRATAQAWLVPAVRTRASDPQTQLQSPTIAAARHLASLGVTATPLHESLLTEPLEWDNSGLREIWHHYALFEACPAAVRAGYLTWVPLTELLGRRHALHPVQGPALRRAVARARHPVAPFDGPERTRELYAWIHERLSAIGARMTGVPTARRMRRWEMILDVPTTAGRMHVKAGSGQTPRAALFVRELHALLPPLFPRIVAADADRHWWLMSHAETGGRLTDRGSEATWLRAVRAVAEAQRQVLQSPDALEFVRARAFGPVQLAGAIARLPDLLTAGPYQAEWPSSRLAAIERVLHAAMYRLIDHDLPRTWIPVAFRLRDLCLGGGHVRFNEPEDGYYGPPTLALSRFLDDLRVRAQVPEPILLRLQDGYIEAWSDLIPADLLRRALDDTLVPAWLFDFWIHLDRLFRCDRVSPFEDAAHAAHPTMVEHAHRLATRLPPSLPPAPVPRRIDRALPAWRSADWRARNSS